MHMTPQNKLRAGIAVNSQKNIASYMLIVLIVQSA